MFELVKMFLMDSHRQVQWLDRQRQLARRDERRLKQLIEVRNNILAGGNPITPEVNAAFDRIDAVLTEIANARMSG